MLFYAIELNPDVLVGRLYGPCTMEKIIEGLKKNHPGGVWDDNKTIYVIDSTFTTFAIAQAETFPN